MKFLYLIPFSLLTMVQLFGYDSIHVLNMENPKKGSWSLTPEFIKKYATLFKATIFIETGTNLGGTTRAAAPYFDEIHTIELHPAICEQARKRLEDQAHIHVYQGDSSTILPTILEKAQGTPLFWLDGHWSGGVTALGEKTTPILEELAAIEHSGIKHGIILIDDIRCFEPHHLQHAILLDGYPTVQMLQDSLLRINPDYCICVMGDSLLAYQDSTIIPSPVVAACSKSRLFDPEHDDIQEIMHLEQDVIALAGEDEFLAIKSLFMDNCSNYLGKDYALWLGLMFDRRGAYDKAVTCFSIAIEFSQNHQVDHWRYHWYMSQAAYKAKQYSLAESEFKNVCASAPKSFLEGIIQ